MRGKLFGVLAAIALLAFAAPSWALGPSCTAGVAINTSTSTKILDANDVAGGRHYLSLQCQGSNTCYCALNSTNAATTTNGYQLTAGQEKTFTMSGSTVGYTATVPNTDVACISTGGASNVVVCDF